MCSTGAAPTLPRSTGGVRTTHTQLSREGTHARPIQACPYHALWNPKCHSRCLKSTVILRSSIPGTHTRRVPGTRQETGSKPWLSPGLWNTFGDGAGRPRQAPWTGPTPRHARSSPGRSKACHNTAAQARGRVKPTTEVCSCIQPKCTGGICFNRDCTSDAPHDWGTAATKLRSAAAVGSCFAVFWDAC